MIGDDRRLPIRNSNTFLSLGDVNHVTPSHIRPTRTLPGIPTCRSGGRSRMRKGRSSGL